MRLHEISNDDALFLKAGYALYKHDRHYVRPLDSDINDLFAEKKNKLFRAGAKAKRWVLFGDGDKLIGRVAAFVNPRYLFSGGYKSGGIGFFDCIDDQNAANMLFDASTNWLRGEGMQAVDGPINFGERNMWWGCLTDGYDDAPTYGMNYNPSYYPSLFERYGFQMYFEQFVYKYDVEAPVPEKFYDKSRRIEANPKYSFQHFRKAEIDRFAEEFTLVYNAAWGKHEHFQSFRKEQALVIFKKMLPVMDEKVIWFGYYEGKPIAFFIMLPDINRIVRHVNGKLGLIGKLKFKYYQLRGETDRLQGILFGVVPAQQSKGVEGAIIIAAAKVVQPLRRYKSLEMNWIGDFNPKMIHMVEGLGVTVAKRYKTYRLMLQPSLEFRRAPIID